MADHQDQIIVVAGATGLQGGAVARRLAAEGWRVRGLTRDPDGEKARALAAQGVEVVQADMEQPADLDRAMDGAYGVYNVQNPMISGVEGEVRQGKNVARAAAKAGVRHVVYGSAGMGYPGTGVPSWESKLEVEGHMKSLGLALTVLRPMAFMELMTEKKFFPQVAAWHVMPAVMGGARKVGWLCAQDLAFIAARAFDAPEEFTGRDIQLASDVQTMDECRAIYREVMARHPARFPMPAWLFRRFGFVGKDLGAMWSWLRTAEFEIDTRPTLAIHPQAHTVQSWLKQQKQENPALHGAR